MLNASHVSFSRGGHVVIADASVAIGPRSRLGLVGPNGVGKTTLLRLLAGDLTPETGTVTRTPASLTVGYLPQEPQPRPGEALLGYLGRRTGVTAASDALDSATEALAADPDVIDAYTEALDRYLALGGDDFDARVGAVCADLGLPADRLGVALAELSGGQAARAALAAVLLSRFDVFLLDEPTNNLDFDGLDRLEAFVASLPGAMTVVSHDRAFLDRTVTRIVEIDEHSRGAVEYAGTWSDYMAARVLARSQQSEAYQQYTTERRDLQDRARTQRQWAVQGVAKAKKDPKDNDKAQRGFAVNRTEKQAAKVRATDRRIAQLKEVDKPWEGWELRLSLRSTTRSGDVVARLVGAVVARGAFTLGPVDLEVGFGERVAIVGANGSGKTTLLRAILGELALSAGQRYLGPGVVVGELDQARLDWPAGTTLLDAFVRRTGLALSEARSLMAKFALGPGHISREAATLSPGERTRASLAWLMASGVNCLVLDEPTNHLDLEAITQLESALAGFDGTLFLVTHDRRFLEAVAVTRTVRL